MLGIHRTPTTTPGRCAAPVRAKSRLARHRLHKSWTVACLEGRKLLSQFSVTNLNDGGAGSLRQAIVDSNNTAGPNEIDFAASLSGTITLTSGELLIANNAVTILGPGQDSLSVSGNGNSRVFEVASGVTASLSGITVAGGTADNGGGISNHGAVTINACTVSGNRATNQGGAIFDDGSNFSAIDCTFRGNSSDTGGALMIEGKSSAVGCTFSGNSSSGDGGAVCVASIAGSSLSAMNCTFSGNSGSSGGAIDVTNKGSLTLTNCTLAGNSATNGTGSGVYVSGSMTSTNSIYQNPGGNIDVFPGATFT
jgi:predicted outer membrane repeat protein